MLNEDSLQSGLMEALDQPVMGIELPPRTILARIGITFVITFLLSQVYRYLNRDKADKHVMMHSMVYIGTILSGAMMIIGTNLATAFGLLGAVSIIRFRTVVENSVDMSYIFLAIVIGISSGLGLFMHAVVVSIFVGAVMFFLNFLHALRRSSDSNRIRLTVLLGRKAMKSAEIDSLLSTMGAEAILTSIKARKKSFILEYELPAAVFSSEDVRQSLDSLSRLDETVRIKISKANSQRRPKPQEDLRELMSLQDYSRELHKGDA